jgi:uncharacterized membrane protein
VVVAVAVADKLVVLLDIVVVAVVADTVAVAVEVPVDVYVPRQTNWYWLEPWVPAPTESEKVSASELAS